MTNSLLAFTLFALILAITPGLDTMLVLRTSAAGGRAAGLAAVAGISLGCMAWAVASAVGVTAILAASRVAFEVLRVAGVICLCWLGGRALWYARRPHDDVPPRSLRDTLSRSQHPDPPSGRDKGALYGANLHGRAPSMRTGLITNLLNPKVGVFYLSVLPQFLPDGVNPLLGSLALASIHVTVGFVWLTLVVLAVTRASRWLTRPNVRRRLEQLTGFVFLGFGLRLALERAP